MEMQGQRGKEMSFSFSPNEINRQEYDEYCPLNNKQLADSVQRRREKNQENKACPETLTRSTQRKIELGKGRSEILPTLQCKDLPTTFITFLLE